MFSFAIPLILSSLLEIYFSPLTYPELYAMFYSNDRGIVFQSIGRP